MLDDKTLFSQWLENFELEFESLVDLFIRKDYVEFAFLYHSGFAWTKQQMKITANLRALIPTYLE